MSEITAKEILVLEDDPEIGNFYKDLLSDEFGPEKLKVTIVYNGKEGLEKIKDKKYDLILSDIKMPEMDGIEFVENNFINTVNRDTPVILVSGFISLTDEKLQDASFQNVTLLEKPFKPNSFIRQIKLAVRIS